MPSDFLACLKDPAWRESARRLLIAKYFEPSERIALYELTGIPVPPEDQIQRDAQYESPDKAQNKGREVRFRLRIIAAYDYTCALTGYRLTTISGSTILDTAHIHQFSDSRNNDPRNGLALCKNARWLFDKGLWTINDDYRIVVAIGRFAEDSPDQKGLRLYQGEKIRLPSDPELSPNPIHTAWHRKHRFQGV